MTKKQIKIKIVYYSMKACEPKTKKQAKYWITGATRLKRVLSKQTKKQQIRAIKH